MQEEAIAQSIPQCTGASRWGGKYGNWTGRKVGRAVPSWPGDVASPASHSRETTAVVAYNASLSLSYVRDGPLDLLVHHDRNIKIWIKNNDLNMPQKSPGLDYQCICMDNKISPIHEDKLQGRLVWTANFLKCFSFLSYGYFCKFPFQKSHFF